MHVERLDVEGFRNCCSSIHFDPELTLLLGENNAGKTNIVDALRLALVAEDGTDRLRPRPSDFARGAHGKAAVDEFKVTAVLAGLSVREQGLLAHALAPKTEAHGKARIGLYASLGADQEVTWHRFGGDFDRSDVEQQAFNAVHHTYLPPLRDAGSDLQPGRSNRLARLLQVLTPDQADRDALVKVAQDANDQLGNDPKVRKAVELVQEVLDGMTLKGHAQKADIAFADAEFSALVRQLLAQLGEKRVAELSESGLGYQNLLYMAVLLAHLSEVDAKRVPLRVLLVEEPEAHLHPQLQDLLLRFLQEPKQAAVSRQVIVTSNSPQFASAAELNRLVVITRPRGAPQAAAHPIRNAKMDEADRQHVRRFLDVTKATLFFARGVIFVEGVSEQLLLPHFARLEGHNLADSGVTIINIGGVAFAQFAALFGDEGLPIPCSVISDSDADPTKPNEDDPQLVRSDRAKELAALDGTGTVKVFLADVTLEWDLAKPQPRAPNLTAVMNRVHPVSGPQVAAATGKSAPAWATMFRDKLTKKAVFAQELAAELDGDHTKKLQVPEYLRKAIDHAVSGQPAGQPSPLPQAPAASPKPAAGDAA